MICFNCILREDLQGKDIYLWDVGKYAMWLFYAAASREINIRGFVTNDQHFCGQVIMNRPILSPECFQKEKNAIMLMSDKVTKGTEELVRTFGECYRWSEALSINPILKNSAVWIYGLADDMFHEVAWLESNNAIVKGFLTDDVSHPQTILGTPVYGVGDAQFTETDSILIPEKGMMRDHSVIDLIQQNGFCGKIFLPDLAPEAYFWAIDFWTVVDQAIKNERNIFFCCEDPMSRNLFSRIFSFFGVTITKIVTFDGSVQDGLENIWVLAGEDPEQSTLLIHSFSEGRRVDIVDTANDLGYKLETHNYAATDNALFNRRFIESGLCYEFDEKLGVSIDYTPVGGYPGWAVYGNKEGTANRIMVLGGSTSSEVFYPENWVSKLYKRLIQEGKDVVIFNGAHCGNRVFHEINRCMRDIRFLKPDIVISLSGYNDLKIQNNKFEWFKQEESFAYWRRMESYMKQIAESEGAAFYAVLQPVNQNPENTDLYEILHYHSQVHMKARVFTAGKRNDDFYYDLFTLFLHQPEMLIDLDHYSELGNEILAEKIHEIIKGSLK